MTALSRSPSNQIISIVPPPPNQYPENNRGDGKHPRILRIKCCHGLERAVDEIARMSTAVRVISQAHVRSKKILH